MQIVLFLVLAVSLVSILVGLGFGLFAKGKRRRGWNAVTIALFGAIFSVIGLIWATDEDARSEGYLDYLDQLSASAAGYEEPNAWADERDARREQQRAEEAAIREHFELTAAEIKEIEEGLTLEYIRQDRWPAVRCKINSVQNRSFAFCEGVGTVAAGGLFLLSRNNGDAVVTPMNGRAMQHFSAVRYVTSITEKRFPVLDIDEGDLRGQVELISTALASFE
ncbi:MAG: hypothetical protein P0Y65_00325 [Candidatus Devosia phytovorans]|uniref:Uncharacterized protein n=1 Tax=Candidatus Devosia phytovorans TaxID=3121372 RepID=A0AAJ5VVP1_9HYPH|nr:hypothetical protein [Devosia sp.]WEK04740.1 MAG: hypothetical protein P0Y65_00325 [Devosia sp.]